MNCPQKFIQLLGSVQTRGDSGLGIGRALMQRVKQEFPGPQGNVKALDEAKHFFEACGYRRPRVEMTVLFTDRDKQRCISFNDGLPSS